MIRTARASGIRAILVSCRLAGVVPDRRITLGSVMSHPIRDPDRAPWHNHGVDANMSEDSIRGKAQPRIAFRMTEGILYRK